MKKAQFVRLSDLVEDGQSKVDDPEEENKLLKAIIETLLVNITEGESSILDSQVNDDLKCQVLKI